MSTHRCRDTPERAALPVKQHSWLDQAGFDFTAIPMRCTCWLKRAQAEACLRTLPVCQVTAPTPCGFHRHTLTTTTAALA